jgi:hypothetical protein
LRLLGSFPSNRESTRSRRQEECRVTDQSVRATPPRGSTHDRLGCPATENDHIRDIAGGFAELGVAAIGPELHHRTSERALAYGDVGAVRPHSGAMKPETIAADAKAAAA